MNFHIPRRNGMPGVRKAMHEMMQIMREWPNLTYSVRMRGQHKAEDWKGTVAYMPEQIPNIEEIRTAHDKLGPLIALWQYQLSRGSLTSLETSAVEAAAELHGHVLLLLNSVDVLLVLRGRIEDHDKHAGAPDCYHIGTKLDLT